MNNKVEPDKKALISTKDMSFSYGESLVLDSINMDVFAGEFLGIVGPNAGGKSTLLKLMLGLIEPTQGAIAVYGRSPVKSRHRIGYVPQYPAFARDFPITVQDAVLMGRLGQCGGILKSIGWYQKSDYEIAANCMREMEILNLKDMQLSTLSGGQLQRVLLARALASEPEILMLDEPTANVDMRLETDIFDLLKQLNERMTIIVVSHDIGFISSYVSRVACVNGTLLCHDTASIDGQVINDLYHSDVHMVEHNHG